MDFTGFGRMPYFSPNFIDRRKLLGGLQLDPYSQFPNGAVNDRLQWLLDDQRRSMVPGAEHGGRNLSQVFDKLDMEDQIRGQVHQSPMALGLSKDPGDVALREYVASQLAGNTNRFSSSLWSMFGGQ